MHQHQHRIQLGRHDAPLKQSLTVGVKASQTDKMENVV